MKEYEFKKEKIMICSDRNIRVVKHEDDTIVTGALTKQGVWQLTSEVRSGTHDNAKEIKQLDDGSVYLIFK